MSALGSDMASNRLVEVATAITVDGGPSALTARALAQHAGASPSAVNYHFGGRDGLLGEVHRNLRGRREAWRRRRLAEATAGSPAWAFVVAAVSDLAFAQRGESLALLEFEPMAGEAPAELARAIHDEHAAQDRFWAEAARRLGGDDGAALVWSHVARTATRFALIDTTPAPALLWLSPAMLRVAERLDGRPTPAATPWLAAATPPGTLPERPAGAQRLVGAALRLIGERGLHAVTLRSVAQAAGLSLASTTYFFETKADIVHAAFTQLRDGISHATLDADRRAGDVGDALIGPAGEMRWEVGAMLALFLAGARNDDLRPVALSLRRLSGQTSAAWLARHVAGPCDRLDAFIWSCFGMGLQEHLLHLAPEARRATMDLTGQQAGARLFGISTDPA
ncbi:MAG: TetR family transcriptional regulator [Phenylobacterium sp.]|uniref:TetR family transcriptional regulator n=1 Tax=Phenylobacterium sp. TaxID=1871053 RepID=UPI0025CD5BCC|nr:TetR family transcriptional regulator [Phenylobacterium sp.]MBI1198320.1 TetR family transcriptional regulator [Phenylobacterium sp.]